MQFGKLYTIFLYSFDPSSSIGYYHRGFAQGAGMRNVEWKCWQYGLLTMVSLSTLLWCGAYLIASHPYTHATENARAVSTVGLAVSLVFFPHAFFQFVRTLAEKCGAPKILT